MEKYVQKHRPPMVLLENVVSLFSKRKAEGGESACLELQISSFGWF